MSTIKMEEEETESVTEAKTMSVKKKVDVLEAMAKYNLKKQQERELSMMSTIKVKEEDAKEKEEVKKPEENKQSYHYNNRKDFGNRQRKNFGNQHKRQFQESRQPVPTKFVHTQQVDSKKESKVGIIEFVNKGAGFSAILKQRYSDFHVNEIDMEEKIVHLTNQAIPVAEQSVQEPPSEEELSVLTDDQWKSIEEMMQSEEPKTVEIDVTVKSKDERQSIHKLLRRKFDGIISNSSHIDGKTVMKVSKSTGSRHERRRLGPAYTQFVLYKENLSTMEAISLIARKTRMKAGLFMTAGTKDKRGITSQLVTVKNVDPKKLLNSVRNDCRVAVGNFSFVEKPLELGHLKGNRFIIALRNVVGNENEIQTKLESLKENGFINYYGAQRFGTRHVPTHHIGKQLLLQRWQEAIDLILEPPEVTGKFQREYDLLLARVEYRASKDAFKACALLNRSGHTIEGQLLSSLKSFGKDLVGALNTIPRNLRLTYIHAYQSFLWNSVVSKRLAKFGFTPIVGDLVYASPGSDEADIEADTEIVNGEVQLKEPENEASTEKEGDGGVSKSRAQRNQRQVITIDESNIQNYTINDVVLPLPGFDITYPSNEVAGWFTELLEADGLTELDFKKSVKTYNLGGAYRLVMSKPQDVKWKFVRYDDPSLSLIPSDWDRLENNQSPPAVVEGGAFLGLILEFNLPPSAYATMALREITKMDMSAEFQTSLNEAGTSKEPTTDARQEPTTEEPEMKRIKQESVETQEV